MKSCLKCVRTSTRAVPALEPACEPESDAAALCDPCKHVSFNAASIEEVFVADEWDRSPAERAKVLSNL